MNFLPKFGKSKSKDLEESSRSENSAENDAQVEKASTDANFQLVDDPKNIAKKILKLGKRLLAKGKGGNIEKMDIFTLVSCLAALGHVFDVTQKNYPEVRIKEYENSSKGSLSKEELLEASEWLEYADLAYETKYDALRKQLEKNNFHLMRHDTSQAPGRVAHFIAFSEERKIGIISLKGTSTLSDVLTDALGDSKQVDLNPSFHSNYPSKQVNCHEGILTAATMMADVTEHIVKYLFIPLGYRIIITGHSLGAGTACLLGLLLRSRISTMKEHPNYSLRVFAYAPPPVLNYEACIACAPFTTSIVNNADTIPRMSISSLMATDQFLGAIKRTLKERELLPTNLDCALKFAEQMKNQDIEKSLMKPEAINKVIQDAFSKEDLLDSLNLYIPGRIIGLYSNGSDDSFAAVVTDASAIVYHAITPSKTFLTDHFLTNYRKSINSVIEQI